NFYLNRSAAASRIGLLSQTIDDLRQAEKLAPNHDLRKQALSRLWNAEANAGNYLSAIAIMERDREARVGAGRGGGAGGPAARGAADACTLPLLRAQLGDVPQAREYLSACE